MTIRIRSLTSAGQPFLWEMLYHALHVPAGYPPLPREVVHEPEISRYVEGWGRAGDLGSLAEEDGKPAGAAWLRLWSGQDKGFGYVDESTPELSIAVLPACRGQGIGSRLLDHLIRQACPCYAAISLSVSSDNPARRLYERYGFQVVQDDGSSLVMVRLRRATFPKA